MAAEKRLYLIKKNLSLFVNLLILIAAVDAVLAIITFVLYGRARMQEQEQKEKQEPEIAQAIQPEMALVTGKVILNPVATKVHNGESRAVIQTVPVQARMATARAMVME